VSSVFVDTNVFAYQFDVSEPIKRERAIAALDSDRDFVISTQVMLELHSVLTRKLRPPVSPAKARSVLDRLAKLPVVTADARLVCRAAATSERHRLSIWDAMIVEAAAEAGCAELWSEDLASRSVLNGVRVVNPFP
jgi:predicted nucleic acid-binding protein